MPLTPIESWLLLIVLVGVCVYVATLRERIVVRSHRDWMDKEKRRAKTVHDAGHRLWTETTPTYARAKCSCGWRGHWFEYRFPEDTPVADAYEEMRDHEDEVLKEVKNNADTERRTRGSS